MIVFTGGTMGSVDVESFESNLKALDCGRFRHSLCCLIMKSKPRDMVRPVMDGERLPQPKNCLGQLYGIIQDCWRHRQHKDRPGLEFPGDARRDRRCGFTLLSFTLPLAALRRSFSFPLSLLHFSFLAFFIPAHPTLIAETTSQKPHTHARTHTHTHTHRRWRRRIGASPLF